MALSALGSAASFAAITMTVNTEAGQTISGTHKFVARVTSNHLVTSVEFYVGDDLRGTDDSTPYEFTLDTLEETQGKIEVTFAAYNAEGESTKKVLSLNVENEMSKGVAFHVARSTELLTDGKLDEAIYAARVALKIEPTNNPARVAMARANFAKGVYDIAQKFAEDAVATEPTNRDARALLAAINLRKAFSASGPDSVELIQGALQIAAKNQFEILINAADNAGEPTGENILPYVDKQIEAHRYNRAVQVLKPVFDADVKVNEVADRYVYALIRLSRFAEAQTAIRQHKQFGEPSGYMYALEAIMLQFYGQVAPSEEAEKEAILSAAGSDFVKYAQAYLALARNRIPVLNGVAREFQESGAANSMANYYRAVAAYYSRDYDGTRSLFERAVLADPANYDMFIERGNQTLDAVNALGMTGEDARKQRQIALAYFNAALAARPESFEALTGLSIAHTMLGNYEEAVSFGRGATAAAPQYGAGHFALSSAYRGANNMTASRAALNEAGKVDPRLAGRSTPRPDEAWQFFFLNARIPLIPAP